MLVAIPTKNRILSRSPCQLGLSKLISLRIDMNSIRVLVFRAHLLELIVSVVATGLGLLLWLSAKPPNSEANLIVGAGLVVAGVMVSIFAMKSIL